MRSSEHDQLNDQILLTEEQLWRTLAREVAVVTKLLEELSAALDDRKLMRSDA